MNSTTEHYMKIGSLKIFYRKVGAGRPLILLHGGWMTGGLSWSPHYEALAKQFQIFSPDFRGHGKTNDPIGSFSSYGGLAWEIISFIENLELDEKPLVVGHSCGALVSMFMSIYQPQLLAGQVLVGVNSSTQRTDCFNWGMEKFFNTPDYRIPPTKLDYILNHPLRAAALWHAHEAPWFELLQRSWPMWIKPLELGSKDYAKITIPTLIISGTEDEFGDKEHVEKFQIAIPGCKLKMIEGANHMFAITKPKLLQENMLPFLTEPQ